MNSATPTPSGTATSRAMAEDRTVTHSRLAMPNFRTSPSTLHSLEVRKLTWSLASAGTACDTRKAPISTTRVMTSRPAPLAAPPKRRSPRRPVDAPSPLRDPGPEAAGELSAVETPVTEVTLDQNLEVGDRSGAYAVWPASGREA